MERNHRYIAGLDGIRAIAVLAVIAYHFSFSWARGGFLGVDIFFVLSGYLITSIILPEHGNQLDFSLRKFWMGRIRRLLPAAYVMIITTSAWVVLFNRELLTTIRGDAIASVFYVSNWWFIFHKLSYFDSFGSPSPLKNLWSLAIEEQFYLVWPLVLVTGLIVFKKRSRFSMIVWIGALCSALWMGILFQPGEDPSRIYYGTDTRSFELLIGCWLAIVWPMKRLSSNKLPTQLKYMLNLIGFLTFSIFIVCVLFVDEYTSFLYRGGMLLFSLNAAILIACVCHPSSFLGYLLSFKPLRWIGTRSYGIYLWHYPVMVLSTPVQEIGNPVYGRVVLQIAIILIIAELSYRYIEMPIRKQGFRLFFRQLLPMNLLNWRSASLARRLSTMLVFMVLLVFSAGITGIVEGEEQKEIMDSRPTEIKISSAIERKSLVEDKIEKEVEKENKQLEQASQEEKKEVVSPSIKKVYKEVLAIGDSVMLDIASSLHKANPNITIDAKVGRQVSQAVKLTPDYAAFNHPDKAVIIQLGTNGYFSENQIDTLLNSFSNADIFLVNTRVPRPWESKVNQSLHEKAKENDNITLVDWYSVALSHPEYFAEDGVHLMPKGVQTLTSLINQMISSGTGI
ncbi:acyltransferase family protein [Peribacillus alkalitolerans]|uniref:acyltransferase family protein n=1 Tax=Peribacillus alkalitolerans TaxID=1550385 RepID=UPI0013D6A46B|nr:acyltransferase family protein [Peribacillus alkalitolerans]